MTTRKKIAILLLALVLTLSMFGCMTMSRLENYEPSAADACAAWCDTGGQVPPGCSCE